MGFNIQNNKDNLIIKPTFLGFTFGSKLIIDKSIIKKSAKVYVSGKDEIRRRIYI